MYVRIGNRKIHYKILGKGKPIIFVHGWGGSIYSLHPLAQDAAKKFSAIIVDLPGFGKSDNPPPHWGVEGYADLLFLFMRELHLVKPIYVGHSFGGAIGIFLASHYPDFLDKLILCNSSFKREQKVSKFTRILKLLPSNKGIFKIIEPYIRKMYYKLFHRDSDLMKYPHLEANFRKIVTQDLSSDAKKILIPTLVLWAENDTQTPVLWAYELEKLIKDSRLVVYPDSGHNLPLKQPDEIWNQIQGFVDSNLV